MSRAPFESSFEPCQLSLSEQIDKLLASQPGVTPHVLFTLDALLHGRDCYGGSIHLEWFARFTENEIPKLPAHLLVDSSPLQVLVILTNFFEYFPIDELSRLHEFLEAKCDPQRHYRAEGRELSLSQINPFRTGAQFWTWVPGHVATDPKEDDLPLRLSLNRAIQRLSFRAGVSQIELEALTMMVETLRDYLGSVIRVASKINGIRTENGNANASNARTNSGSNEEESIIDESESSISLPDILSSLEIGEENRIYDAKSKRLVEIMNRRPHSLYSSLGCESQVGNGSQNNGELEHLEAVGIENSSESIASEDTDDDFNPIVEIEDSDEVECDSDVDNLDGKLEAVKVASGTGLVYYLAERKEDVENDGEIQVEDNENPSESDSASEEWSPDVEEHADFAGIEKLICRFVQRTNKNYSDGAIDEMEDEVEKLKNITEEDNSYYLHHRFNNIITEEEKRQFIEEQQVRKRERERHRDLVNRTYFENNGLYTSAGLHSSEIEIPSTTIQISDSTRYPYSPDVNGHYPDIVTFEDAKTYYINTSLAIDRSAFANLVSELIPEALDAIEFSRSSLLVIQEAAEQFVANVLRTGERVTAHALRNELFPRDMLIGYRISKSIRY